MTTVKTVQAPTPRGASVSVAAQELQPEAAGNLPSWEMLEPASAAPRATHDVSSLTALPMTLSLMRAAMSDKASSKSRRGKGKTKAVNLSIGNDARIPWLRRPSVRHEIEVSEQIFEAALATSTTVTPTYAAIIFTVSALSNFTSLAACFDQYMIKEIEVIINPTVTEVTTASSYGEYASAVDIDDGNAPTALADVCVYETSVESKANISHFHRWQPQFATAVYSGAFTSFAAMRGWIDCASPAVQHYGIKVGLGAAANAQGYTYSYRMRVGFRSVH